MAVGAARHLHPRHLAFLDGLGLPAVYGTYSIGNAAPRLSPWSRPATAPNYVGTGYPAATQSGMEYWRLAYDDRIMYAGMVYAGETI